MGDKVRIANQKPLARLEVDWTVHPRLARTMHRLAAVIHAIWAAWLRTSVWTRSILVATTVYGVVFSILTALRVYALDAQAYDLGIYHQSMYTTVFNQRFFFNTIDLPSNPSGSVFGVHFSPILLLLLIPYALVPSPLTLTVLQTWAIALAALPLYALGRRVLHSERIAFVLGVVYLLHPATQGVNWYDFHPEAFLPLAVLTGLYFFERREWTVFLVSMALALSTIEAASFLVAALALGFLLSSVWSLKKLHNSVDSKETRALLFLLGLASVWLVLGRAVELALNPRNPYFSGVSGGSGYWSVLGASGLLDVPVRIITNPVHAFAALSYDAPLKIWYILALFGPVLFMPARSLHALFFCVPWMVVALLSNNPPFYSLGDQYPAFVLPFIFYGTVIGIARPSRTFDWFRSHTRPIFARARSISIRTALPPASLTTTIVLLVVASPLGPVGFATYPVGGFPWIGYHERAVDSLYSLIPASASVLTQNNLFPLVSNRANAFFIPIGTLHPPGTSFNSTMGALMASVDYVLADYGTRPNEAAVIYDWANRTDGFGVVGSGDGAVLLQRGSPALALFTPFTRTYEDSSVIVTGGSRVADPLAEDDSALRHSPNETSNFWFGPYAQLSPGVYEVSYRIRVDDPSAGTILDLPVILWPFGLVGTVLESATAGSRTGFDLKLVPGRLVIADLNVDSATVPAKGQYFWLTQSFSVTALGLYEFPGLTGAGSMGLWFDGLRVEQRVAYGSVRVPTTWVIIEWPPG